MSRYHAGYNSLYSNSYPYTCSSRIFKLTEYEEQDTPDY